MRRFLILAILARLMPWASAGTLQCSATCLSKIASGVSILANGKTIMSGGKKVGTKIGIVKSTKNTKGKKT